MNKIPDRPVIENRLERVRDQWVDVGYLIYEGASIRLTQTELAVATSLLHRGGLRFRFVGRTRGKLLYHTSQRTVGDIGPQPVANALSSLRKKLAEHLGDRLVIPHVAAGGQQARTQGLRMWTRSELDEIRKAMTNPGRGVVTLQDERAQNHLFVDGKEIKPANRQGVPDLYCRIVKLAASPKGFTISALEVTVKPLTVQLALTELRRLLEREVGMTLTARVGGTNIKEVPVRLIPHRPDSHIAVERGKPAPTADC